MQVPKTFDVRIQAGLLSACPKRRSSQTGPIGDDSQLQEGKLQRRAHSAASNFSGDSVD